MSGSLRTLPPGQSPTRSFSSKFSRPQGNISAFTGSFSPALDAFTAKVTLIYNTDSDLSGTHAFSGTAGAGEFMLTMAGGVRIQGQITTGGNLTSIQFAGSGSFDLSR
jgi:hypothetical protein